MKFSTVSFFLYCHLFNSNFKPIKGKQNVSDWPQQIFEIFHFASCKQSNLSNIAFATDGNCYLAPNPCAALVGRCMQGIPRKLITSYSIKYSMIKWACLYLPLELSDKNPFWAAVLLQWCSCLWDYPLLKGGFGELSNECNHRQGRCSAIGWYSLGFSVLDSHLKV